jgi:hypothetical protein
MHSQAQEKTLGKAAMISMAVLFAAVLAAEARADNFNRCMAQSTGLGGYQFKNNCGVPIHVYFRPGGIDGAMGGGSWHAMTLRSGEMKVVTSYSSPVACPITHEGKEVSLDPKTRDCVIKQR